MKRSFAFLVVLALLASIFTACGAAGAPAAEATPQAAGAASGGPGGTIQFYYWDEGQKPGMDAVVELLKASNPEIEVVSTITPFAQYWTKLQTSLPSDSGPDVFWNNYEHAIDYLPAGLAENLTPFVERDGVDMSNFPESLNTMYTYEGNIYGIPKDFDTVGLWYNKGIFDAKNEPYPTEDWTWDDLRAAAMRLTDETTFGVVFRCNNQNSYFPWMLSNGGTILSEDRSVKRFNTPEGVEAVQWLVDAMYVDKFAPTGADLKELTYDEYFQSGQAAMIPYGNYRLPQYYEALGENLGVTYLPTAPGGREATIVHGLGIMVSAKSQNKEAAWALTKTFASKEAGDAQSTVVIPAYEGAHETYLAHYPGIDLKIFTEGAAYADLIGHASSASAAQNEADLAVMEAIWMNEMPVAEGLAKIDADCDAIVAAQ